MAYNFCDEYGRPYVLIREQETRRNSEEKSVLEENTRAFLAISEELSTSFGPFGADKAILSPDGEVTVTNDGATIVKEMGAESTPIGRLVTQLSAAQDEEVGDGTTGVVILAGALLKEATALAKRGMHPLRIARGIELALDVALDSLQAASREITPTTLEQDMKAVAKSTLGSKIASRDLQKYVDMAISAVVSVEDERGEANMQLIRIEGETKNQHSEIVRGVYIPKEFSHFQMKKEIKKARIALLACPLEPPKLKIKHDLNVKGAEEYAKLAAYEQDVFRDMISALKKAEVSVVLCQWGFDDEANSLLLQHGISAVRWVGAQELEMAAVHCGASIVSQLEALDGSMLGIADVVEKSGAIRIESGSGLAKGSTLVLRAATQAAVEELKRSMHDALCVVRNVRKHKNVVAGAGIIDLICSRDVALKMPGSVGRAFSAALLALPMALARNAGKDPIEEVARSYSLEKENGDQSVQVWESAFAKKHQYILAAQTVKSIIKIDDVFGQW